jgi:hypothetical protein
VVALAGAEDAAAFCRAWLDLQCATTPGAFAGLILLEGEAAPSRRPRSGRRARATSPTSGHCRTRARIGEAVIESDPVGSAGGAQTRVAYPIQAGDRACGVIVLTLAGPRRRRCRRPYGKLHWGVGWILSMVWRHRADQEGRSGRDRGGGDGPAGVAQEHERLDAARWRSAMRWPCGSARSACRSGWCARTR